MLVLSFLVVKVWTIVLAFALPLTLGFAGAAADKVAALERAGVVVTDSPAKIGAEMLKVCSALIVCDGILTFGKGNEGGRSRVDEYDSYTIVHSIVLNSVFLVSHHFETGRNRDLIDEGYVCV